MDLHSHTHHSADGWTSPRRLVARARAVGLARIAVTDHGRIEGALEAQALDPELVIVGEEIRCAGGTELIGLFLRRHVPDGLAVEEAAEAVREQGGIVYAPHPFAYASGGGAHARRVLAVADIAEVFNPRAFYRGWNLAARAEARQRGLPGAASSDAHFPWEIGRAFTEVQPFSDPASLLAAIGSGCPVSKRVGTVLDHVGSMTLQATRLLRRRPRRGLAGAGPR